MSKPIVHARSSAKKFGGVPDDYLDLHDFMDSTKAHVATVNHRAVLHNSYGPFVLEMVFGHTRKNSEGREYHVRDIGEQHIMEDLGFIPSLEHWVREIPLKPWMAGACKGVLAKDPDRSEARLNRLMGFKPAPGENTISTVETGLPTPPELLDLLQLELRAVDMSAPGPSL